MARNKHFKNRDVPISPPHKNWVEYIIVKPPRNSFLWVRCFTNHKVNVSIEIKVVTNKVSKYFLSLEILLMPLRHMSAQSLIYDFRSHPVKELFKLENSFSKTLRSNSIFSKTHKI